MAMGEVLSRQHVNELGFEGDALDGAKFKHIIKSEKPWYMTFVQSNDAKGLFMWLKRAVNSLAVSKWSKASACLNRLTDELSELTIEQGFPQGFIIQATTVALLLRPYCAGELVSDLWGFRYRAGAARRRACWNGLTVKGLIIY